MWRRLKAQHPLRLHSRPIGGTMSKNPPNRDRAEEIIEMVGKRKLNGLRCGPQIRRRSRPRYRRREFRGVIGRDATTSHRAAQIARCRRVQEVES